MKRAKHPYKVAPWEDPFLLHFFQLVNIITLLILE